MANKNKVDQLADEFKSDETNVKFKSYSSDGKGFYELSERTEVQGMFIGVRDQEITDIRTHERKMIRVYSMRIDTGEIIKIGSRALLDGLFDDAMDEHGGVTVENKRYGGPGIDWLRNRIVKIIRGADKKQKSGSMGTYEFLIEE